MNNQVCFRGVSGKAWSFQETPAQAPWARSPGVVIFASPEAFGWRVIRVMEMTGKPHDLRPIWALAEAERFGATAVFVALEFEGDVRKAMIEDLEAGFSPVCGSSSNVVSLAA